MKSLKRVIAMLMSVLMLVMAMPLNDVGVQAAATRTQSEAVAWINAAAGKYWDYDGAYGAQCVDLIYFYYKYMGATPAGGNAINYVSNSLPAGWTRIAYYNGFVAQPGDIAVFKGPSSYGHVALVSSANSSKMNIVENNHDGSGTQVANTYSYSYSSMSFYGVIRPNYLPEANINYSTITTGKYYIKNSSTGTYLNVDGGTDTNKQNVSVASFTGGTSMQMEITSATNGYKIRPLCSSSRLINPFADYVSSGVNVNIYNNVNDSSQWWGFEKVSGGYVIRNMQNQNCVLALSGTNVIVSTYTGASNQIWSLESYDTYTISYNANGGSGAPSAQTKTHGVAVKLSTTKPTRSGYTFQGWATSSSGVPATYLAGDTYTANASVTLYAVWKANTYTVTYNANGGSGAPSAQTKTHGVNLTLLAKEPIRSGYTFLGWGTSASATSTSYQPGGIYTGNESITLYAVWQKNTYTTYFDSNGGTNSTYAIREAGEDITFPTYAPSRKYHVFLGWSDSATSTVAQYTLGQTIQANDGNKTFYAVWEAPTVMEDGVEYTVTFGTECLEKYFSFTPAKDGYYMVDETALINCGEILWCYENGEGSFESSLKFLKKDTTYYFKATNEWNNDGEGDVTLSVTYTPITHMSAEATNPVLPSQNKHYYWHDLKPIYTIYAGNSIYFQGTASEFSDNMNLGHLNIDNLYNITVWTEGTKYVEVNLGDLVGQMKVTVRAGNVISIEPIGENKLIENYDGYETTDYYTNITYFYYMLHRAPFNFIVTYDNGYSETLDGYDLNIIDPQNSENIWGKGVYTVIGEYEGVSAEFAIEIIENPIQSLEIISDPITITQYTHGYFSAYVEGYSYDLDMIVKDNPIELKVNYKNGTSEEIELKSTHYEYLSELDVDVEQVGTWDVGTDNYISITYMNHVVETGVEIVKETNYDPISSVKVKTLPLKSNIIPRGTIYSVVGTEIEILTESGEKGTAILEKEYEDSIWVGFFWFNGFKYRYVVNYNYDDNNHDVCAVDIEFLEFTVPVITTEGFQEVVSYEFITEPQTVSGEGAVVQINFSNGTSQRVNTIAYVGTSGMTNVWEHGSMLTDAGFYLDLSYRVQSMEDGQKLKITYDTNGFVYSLDFAETNAKIVARLAQEYFLNGATFEGQQTNKNVNVMVLTAMAYYFYDDGIADGVSLEVAQQYVKETFNIDKIDLTKSIYYDATTNTLRGKKYFDEEFDLSAIFTEQIELYHDAGETWVYKCADNHANVIYVEMKKSTNQILYIGDTYEIATLESIFVVSEPQRTNYYVGDNLDVSGLQLQLNYSDGTTEIITEDFTLSEFDTHQVGTQRIIVTYKGMSTSFNVTVEMPEITVSSTEETLEIDGTVSLSAETTPGSQDIVWTSSNENVATITDGVVTAVAPGTAVITAQFTYNGEVYSETCAITVNEPLPTVTGITVVKSPVKTTYIVGEALDTTGLSLRVDYDNGTAEIVSEGFDVNGYKSFVVGVQTLEVVYEDATTNLTVTVSNPELILSDSERTMVIGGTVQLRVETIPVGQEVVWTSSDTSVATVENGLVTAVDSGTSIVTAHFSYNGTVYSQECLITVIASLTSIEMVTIPTKTVYQMGEQLDTTGLSVQLNYDDGTTKVVTDGFTTYGYDAEKVGNQTVTVYYHGHASTYTVVVEVSEDTPQIVVESKKNVAGKTVTVDVILKNNPGIASARLTLDFDTSVLTLIDVADAGKLGVQCHKAELTSPYVLSWMNDTATENFDYNGAIVTLTFEIAEGAELGDYAINLSYDYDNYDIWNVNVERVKFVAVDGVISVIDTIIGDVNGDGSVNTLDRMTLARHLANWEGYASEDIDMVAADVNGDGIVNTLDRMALARHLSNWSGYETLPCEI